jgi:fructose/tagatose bisphosphate aldolase
MPELKHNIDSLILDAVFAENEPKKDASRRQIRKLAVANGIYPASIYPLYKAAAEGLYNNKTVPAINLRGITYYSARAAFRAALKTDAAAIIFEIARSEIDYTAQPPAEYTACILAAALREGYEGPVFLQGDHFQVKASRYKKEATAELKEMEDLIRQAIEAGFYNIDIDASTLVDLSKPNLDAQQEENALVTAQMTRFIRSHQPQGVTINIGGEVGEVGQRNSTADDVRAFMREYRRLWGSDASGIFKMSVQTGTRHGGVVLPDGSITDVDYVDFDTIRELTGVARNEYGLAGVVQHGASTLPEEAFDKFPEAGTLEIHLATGFQNIIMNSPYFPDELRLRIYAHLRNKYAAEKEDGQTDSQFIYRTRKKAFGYFKKELWLMSEGRLNAICAELEERFVMLFSKLNVNDTAALVSEYVGG